MSFWSVAETSPAILLIAMVVMTFGTVLQASFGIGLSLLVVPVLTLVDPHLAPGPTLFASLGLAIPMAGKDKGLIYSPRLYTSLAGLLLGTAVGAFGLSLVATEYLPKLFGIVILVAVALSAVAAKVRITGRTLFVGGVASGLMGIMAGIHGPPIALVLQSEDPARMRGMLGALFVVGYALTILALVMARRFGLRELALGIGLLPGVGIGWLVAPFVADRFGPHQLRLGVLAISGASAALLVLR
jgi:uncharacterized membrane protein YfcA